MKMEFFKLLKRKGDKSFIAVMLSELVLFFVFSFMVTIEPLG